MILIYSHIKNNVKGKLDVNRITDFYLVYLDIDWRIHQFVSNKLVKVLQRKMFDIDYDYTL
jgi:hypothetical protein